MSMLDANNRTMQQIHGFAFWIFALKWVAIIVITVLLLSHIDRWVDVIAHR